MTMRGKHSEAIQQLKSQFLKEKKQYQSDSDAKINAMAKQATKVRKHMKKNEVFVKKQLASFCTDCLGGSGSGGRLCMANDFSSSQGFLVKTENKIGFLQVSIAPLLPTPL